MSALLPGITLPIPAYGLDSSNSEGNCRLFVEYKVTNITTVAGVVAFSQVGENRLVIIS